MPPNDKPEIKSQPAPSFASLARLCSLPAAIASVALSCFRFPYATFTQSLDSSWTAVLVYAGEKGLQFGRDIVFTYGPLGFFCIHYYSPHAAVARILFEIAMGL